MLGDLSLQYSVGMSILFTRLQNKHPQWQHMGLNIPLGSIAKAWVWTGPRIQLNC